MTGVNIVVGGGSGIGLELVRLMLAEGDQNILLIDNSISAELCAEMSSRICLANVTISHMTDWEQILAQVERIQSISFTLPSCSSRDESVCDLGYTNQFTSNISIVAFALCRLLSESRSRFTSDAQVVLVSSVLSELVAPNDASLDYHVSKAVLESISRYMAVRLGPKIRVNCIAPGLIARDPSSVLYTDAQIVSRIQKAIPLQRPATQAEVANAMWSILSNKLPFLTGQTIVLDGGSGLLEQFGLVR